MRETATRMASESTANVNGHAGFACRAFVFAAMVTALSALPSFAAELGYKDQEADDSYLPATPHALTLDGRLALAKRLRANEDRGGVSSYASETEVHPVGSPYAPASDGWQDLGGGIRRREESFDSRKVIVTPSGN